MNIEVKPTRDWQWMWRVMRQPGIWKKIGGCDECKPEHIEALVMNQENHFLEVYRDDIRVGFFMFLKQGADFDMHTCLEEGAHGFTAKLAMIEAIRWVFDNTDAPKVVGFVDEKRREVRILLNMIGFKHTKTENGFYHVEFERSKLCPVYS